jgi:MFS family permease
VPPQAPPRPPRRRWGVAVLLGLGVLISFFDRSNLSVAAPELEKTFGLSAKETGLLFSAFYWSYALLQIPVGLLVDRLGVTRIGRWGAFLWSAASALTAAATGFGGILGSRMLLGIAEAPSFPVVSKATGQWFPRRERARATAIFDASAKFSGAIGIPFIAFFVVRYGWRSGFLVTSALSLAYFVLFFLLYRDPGSDPRLDPRELEHIRSGGAAPEGRHAHASHEMLWHLLRSPKIWGLAIGFGAYGYSFYLFLTWLPDYIVKTTHMTVLASAAYTATPWAVAAVADFLVGGCLIDALLARGADETRVRKAVLVCGMLVGLAVIGATRTSDPVWITVWISLSLAGLAAAAPVGWSLPSLIAPPGAIGAVGGIMNCAVNMMGIAAPIVTGFIFEDTKSFTDAFLAAAAILVAGILAFVFLLGRIEPMAPPPAARSPG